MPWTLTLECRRYDTDGMNGRRKGINALFHVEHCGTRRPLSNAQTSICTGGMSVSSHTLARRKPQALAKLAAAPELTYSQAADGRKPCLHYNPQVICHLFCHSERGFCAKNPYGSANQLRG